MSGPRILIVEDEAAISDMVAFHLSRAGYDVVQAADCETARDKLADQGASPDSNSLNLFTQNLSPGNYFVNISAIT